MVNGSLSSAGRCSFGDYVQAVRSVGCHFVSTFLSDSRKWSGHGSSKLFGTFQVFKRQPNSFRSDVLDKSPR